MAIRWNPSRWPGQSSSPGRPRSGQSLKPDGFVSFSCWRDRLLSFGINQPATATRHTQGLSALLSCSLVEVSFAISQRLLWRFQSSRAATLLWRDGVDGVPWIYWAGALPAILVQSGQNLQSTRLQILLSVSKPSWHHHLSKIVRGIEDSTSLLQRNDNRGSCFGCTFPLSRQPPQHFTYLITCPRVRANVPSGANLVSQSCSLQKLARDALSRNGKCRGNIYGNKPRAS